ncbi:MAG: hypothetical protein CMJ50_04975 [Planctomycetaceae bacterium]|jgi:hypothetical protein|nr:hypothetical protein [Planctomycetaceae bacterium]
MLYAFALIELTPLPHLKMTSPAMRHTIVPFVPAILLISIVALASAADKRGPTIELFGAKTPADNRAAWKVFRESSDVDVISQHRDDVLVINPGPRGYLHTEQDFTNFVLKLEWRQLEDKKPGRGGVLIRMTGKDKVWPKSLEAQLNAGAAGDFWGLDGYALTGPSQRFKKLEHEQLGTLRNLQKTDDTEKPPGQWNLYEIVADGETVTIKVNGRTVNKATGCDVVAGKICLTAEGDEIHFRNVRLTALPD